MEHSEQIGELIAALALARKKFKPVVRKAENPFYHSKYAELSDFIDATSEGLSDAGLAVVHDPQYDREAQGITLTTLLAHSSGQWMRNVIWVPVLAKVTRDGDTLPIDAQVIASAITYAKRYVYGAMLSVASQGEDDDANVAAGRYDEQRGDWGKSTDTNTRAGVKINKTQRSALWAAMNKSNKTEHQFRMLLSAKYGIESTNDVLKKDHAEIMRWILDEKAKDDYTEELEESVKAAMAKEPQREPGEDDEPPIASPSLDFTPPHLLKTKKK